MKRLKTKELYDSLYAKKRLDEIEKEVEERTALEKKKHEIMAKNWRTKKVENNDDVFNIEKMREFFRNKLRGKK
jgi:hypothetical protein